MDFIKAVSIIGRDLEEALALLDQLSDIKSTHTAEIELARLRVRSASELLKLLPGLERAKSPEIEHAATVDTAGVITTFREPLKGQESEKVKEPNKGQEPLKAQEQQLLRDEQMIHELRKTQEPTVMSMEFQSQETGRTKEPEVLNAKLPPEDLQKTREPLRTQEAQRSILADRFASTDTLGEKMKSAKQDEAITSVMHGKAITDITTAIGMNDRFYFIRELFSGDTIAYQDTIRRLNAATSLGEAMRILDESTVMGSDPAAQSSFVDVVRRKFSLNV